MIIVEAKPGGPIKGSFKGGQVIIDAASSTYVPTESSSGNVTIKLGAARPGEKFVTQERLLQWNAGWLGLSIIVKQLSGLYLLLFLS